MGTLRFYIAQLEKHKLLCNQILWDRNITCNGIDWNKKFSCVTRTRLQQVQQAKSYRATNFYVKLNAFRAIKKIFFTNSLQMNFWFHLVENADLLNFLNIKLFLVIFSTLLTSFSLFHTVFHVFHCWQVFFFMFSCDLSYNLDLLYLLTWRIAKNFHGFNVVNLLRFNVVTLYPFG